jgi:hypothetical protein
MSILVFLFLLNGSSFRKRIHQNIVIVLVTGEVAFCAATIDSAVGFCTDAKEMVVVAVSDIGCDPEITQIDVWRFFLSRSSCRAFLRRAICS